MDRIDIYRKLVQIKPFFEDIKEIKKRESQIVETNREVTLVKGAGGVYFESTVTGGGTHIIRRPKFLLY